MGSATGAESTATDAGSAVRSAATCLPNGAALADASSTSQIGVARIAATRLIGGAARPRFCTARCHEPPSGAWRSARVDRSAGTCLSPRTGFRRTFGVRSRARICSALQACARSVHLIGIRTDARHADLPGSALARNSALVATLAVARTDERWRTVTREGARTLNSQLTDCTARRDHASVSRALVGRAAPDVASVECAHERPVTSACRAALTERDARRLVRAARHRDHDTDEQRNAST